MKHWRRSYTQEVDRMCVICLERDKCRTICYQKYKHDKKPTSPAVIRLREELAMESQEIRRRDGSRWAESMNL